MKNVKVNLESLLWIFPNLLTFGFSVWFLTGTVIELIEDTRFHNTLQQFTCYAPSPNFTSTLFDLLSTGNTTAPEHRNISGNILEYGNISQWRYYNFSGLAEDKAFVWMHVNLFDFMLAAFNGSGFYLMGDFYKGVPQDCSWSVDINWLLTFIWLLGILLFIMGFALLFTTWRKIYYFFSSGGDLTGVHTRKSNKFDMIVSYLQVFCILIASYKVAVYLSILNKLKFWYLWNGAFDLYLSDLGLPLWPAYYPTLPLTIKGLVIRTMFNFFRNVWLFQAVSFALGTTPLMLILHIISLAILNFLPSLVWILKIVTSLAVFFLTQRVFTEEGYLEWNPSISVAVLNLVLTGLILNILFGQKTARKFVLIEIAWQRQTEMQSPRVNMFIKTFFVFSGILYFCVFGLLGFAFICVIIPIALGATLHLENKALTMDIVMALLIIVWLLFILFNCDFSSKISSFYKLCCMIYAQKLPSGRKTISCDCLGERTWHDQYLEMVTSNPLYMIVVSLSKFRDRHSPVPHVESLVDFEMERRDKFSRMEDDGFVTLEEAP